MGFLGRFAGAWSASFGSASRNAACQDGAVFCSAEVRGPSADNCLLLGLEVSEYKFEHFSVKTLHCLLFIVHVQFYRPC